MIEPRIRRACAVIVFLAWWSWLSIDVVLAEKQTIGTTTNPGDIQVVVDDLGAVRFRINEAGVVNDQWFWTGTDPSNGVIIAFNDGSPKRYRSRFFTAGTVVTPISNTQVESTVTTVYRLGGSQTDPFVTQTVTLDSSNKLYDISWTIQIPSGGTSVTGLQMAHGGDTYLLGNDNGFGSWNAATNTVSVHPDLSRGGGEINLIGVTTPQAYQANYYVTVRTNGNSLALSDSVSVSTVDIGMALQWNIGPLSAGHSTTIHSTVSVRTTAATPTPTPGPGTPSATPTSSRTATPTATFSSTPTETPTTTPTSSPSNTPTDLPTDTPQPSPSIAPTETSVATLTPTLTFTPMVPDSPTVTPTAPPTATAVPVTPTPVMSSTPTSVPAATNTATRTAAPTLVPMLSPTRSPTPTGTPTRPSSPTVSPTFSSTPDPESAAIAPPVFDEPRGVISSVRPRLTGRAPGNSKVEIVIDAVAVGTTRVSAQGTFSYHVGIPLAIGSHTVKGRTIVSDGSKSVYSAPITLVIRRGAVLDFDGDGLTDITGHRMTREWVVSRSLLTESGPSPLVRVPGRYPASADYDGDGVWDYGAVGVKHGGLRWSARLSVSRSSESVLFGRSGDTVIVGCRFGDAGEYSLAVLRGRRLSFRTWSGISRGRLYVDAADLRKVVGCGDVDGDGIDEFIISNRDTRTIDRITAVDRMGKRRYVTNLSRFTHGFIARGESDEIPILGAIRGAGSDAKSSELRALRGAFEFPLLLLPSSLDVSSGTFRRNDDPSVTTGITWQKRGSRSVLRMLDNDNDPIPVFQLPRRYRLTKPQHHRRVAGSR